MGKVTISAGQNDTPQMIVQDSTPDAAPVYEIKVPKVEIVEKIIEKPVYIEKIVYKEVEPKIIEKVIYKSNDEELEYKLLQQDIAHRKEVAMLNDEIENESKNLVRLRQQQIIDRKRKRRLMNKMHGNNILHKNELFLYKCALGTSCILILIAAYF